MTCSCGCGSPITPGKKFKRGHNSKMGSASVTWPAPNPSGLCMCGCGEKTPLAPQNDKRLGMVKGQPRRFLTGHNTKFLTGEKSSRWTGGRITTADGYVKIRIDGRYVPEHRYLMEQKLGRPLLRHETIHHKNGKRDDNRLDNLEFRSGPHGPGATHAHCRTCDCFKG